jgi:hypothetical protein
MYQAFSKPDENMHLRALIPMICITLKLEPAVITATLIANWASEEISPKRAYQPASDMVTVAPVHEETIF